MMTHMRKALFRYETFFIHSILDHLFTLNGDSNFIGKLTFIFLFSFSEVLQKIARRPSGFL